MIYHVGYQMTFTGPQVTYKLDDRTIKRLEKTRPIGGGDRLVRMAGGKRIARAGKRRTNAVVAQWDSPLLSVVVGGEHPVTNVSKKDVVTGVTEEGLQVVAIGGVEVAEEAAQPKPDAR